MRSRTCLAFGMAFAACWVGMAVSHAASPDWRNVRHGLVIPDEGYCDQPYVVVTKAGHWLCVLTTGKGHEGQDGQHVVSTTSNDQGRTWSPLSDIEPADGPEASWATALLVPSGRIYVFYDYNGDRVRELRGKPIRADMLGWYCYRYSDDHGASWSAERHRLPMRVTACDRANDWTGQVQIFWGISKPIIVGDAALLAFTKLGKHLLDNGEGWILRSDNILEERDPRRLRWELLPDGEHGIRGPTLGSIQEEHNIVSLGGDDLYCIYRTTNGFPCESYSRDGGHTWSEPAPATYSPNGRVIKHPRACPKLWRTADGRYLLWFHHHGGKTFADRNPAWLCGGVARDGRLHWSQPEIALYDDDPAVRMSYPDLIEQAGKVWITETQKSVARVHPIEPALLRGLWSQVDSTASQGQDAPLPSLVASRDELKKEVIALPILPRIEEGSGITIELRVRPTDLSPGRVLLDATDEKGAGWRISLAPNGTLETRLSDGTRTFEWASDPNSLAIGEERHVAIHLDGGPGILTYVIDGLVSDGGPNRQYGWARVPSELMDINGAKTLRVVDSARDEIQSVRICDRCLRHAETIARSRAAND